MHVDGEGNGKGREGKKTQQNARLSKNHQLIFCHFMSKKGICRESSSLDSGSAQLGVALIEEALGSPHWCCWRRPDDALEVNTTSL
jgi:hypothetical protein